jgi:molecular chaperone GrpE
MNDEIKTDALPEHGATKRDLKDAADELLKRAKQDAKADAESDMSDEFADEVEEEAVPQTPQNQILILEAEKEEMRDQLLRTLAEMENIRKRSERQVLDARIYAVEKFAGDLLSVSDNLARALQALSDEDRAALSEAGKNLFDGIEMTEKELHTAFGRHGVTEIAAEPGDTFDPNVHQAVSNIPSGQPNGTIAALFQNGWKIGERTLRAAMVAVSAGAPN